MKHVFIDIDLEPADLARLRALPGVTIHESPTPRDYYKARPLPAELLRGKQIMLCKHVPENFKDLVDLEWMQIATVGFEQLAPLKLHETQIRVTNARGLYDTAIAEWNLAMMINLVRDVPGMFRKQQTKTWSREFPYHQEIRNKVVGLWGYGGIGRETARLAKLFGMTVHALTRSGAKPRTTDWILPGSGDPTGTLPDRVFTTPDTREFLAGLDFLILCLPRTAKTVGLVGPAEFAAMKPGSFLLNVARGPIVQEAALLDALKNGPLAGAALDVHFAYPLPPEHPLWEMSNVIITPHISGSEKSIYFRPRIGDLFHRNLVNYLEGKPLFNEVTKAEWRETCGVS
ncbi:MAG: D-2-hydroxyacid dehydrogenase [Planctomycetes bacterium]|nr:D-2-hydroxyacid dehydrogenase [Planctomycetota bacterium]